MKQKLVFVLILCISFVAVGCGADENPSRPIASSNRREDHQLSSIKINFDNPVIPRGEKVLHIIIDNQSQTDFDFSPHTDVFIEVQRNGEWVEIPRTEDSLLSYIPLGWGIPASSEGRLDIYLDEWNDSFAPGQYRVGIQPGLHMYAPSVSHAVENLDWIAAEFSIQ